MELLTPRQAAARLAVSYSTVKHWIYLGTLRTQPTAGGHHRIPESEIDRLLAASGRDLPPIDEAPAWHGSIVALSGRNQLRGIVEEVRSEGLLAQVRLRIGNQRLTAIITRDAVDELKLRRGEEALAVIKSTEVMIGRPAALPRRRAGLRSSRARTKKGRNQD
jgi:molybdopterin-binding protein